MVGARLSYWCICVLVYWFIGEWGGVVSQYTNRLINQYINKRITDYHLPDRCFDSGR